VKILHGDNRVGDSKKLFDAESSMDNVKYDLILRGHYHNFNVSSQNNGGYVVTSGCLFGYNPYSVKKMSCNTNASQTLIVVGNDEIESIKPINLQIS
jgi:predicted phosphodiesterase